VLCVGDGAKLKESLVELCQPRQVIGADVHVMKLEIHGVLSFRKVVEWFQTTSSVAVAGVYRTQAHGAA
jgi:hypothetical protein